MAVTLVIAVVRVYHLYLLFSSRRGVFASDGRMVNKQLFPCCAFHNDSKRSKTIQNYPKHSKTIPSKCSRWSRITLWQLQMQAPLSGSASWKCKYHRRLPECCKGRRLCGQVPMRPGLPGGFWRCATPVPFVVLDDYIVI